MEDATQHQDVNPVSPTIHTPGPVAPVTSDRRQLIPPAFGIAALCFFLTFCNLTCGGQRIASVTGINLIIGTELKPPDMFGGDMFGDEGGQIKHIDPNIWAIIAFGSALLGLVAFIRRFKDEDRIGTYAGIAGFISLIILQITIQRMVNNQTEQVVEAEFQIGYWLSVIAFAAAAYLCYERFKKRTVVNIETVNPITSANAQTFSDHPEQKDS